MNHLIATLCLLTAHANLPSEQSLLKAAASSLRGRALEYADNQTPETAKELRNVLAQAQKQGLAKDFAKADAMTDAQLKNFAKYIQVAEVCEVVALDANGFIIRSTLWKTAQPITDVELQNFAKSCTGAVKAKITPGSARPSATGQ